MAKRNNGISRAKFMAEKTAMFGGGKWRRPIWEEAGYTDMVPIWHFAHVGKDDPMLVAYYRSEDDGRRSRLTHAKPGRYLAEFFGGAFSSRRIMDFVAEWALQYGPPPPIKFARTAEEIEQVYLTGPSSCMSHPISFYGSRPLHPVRAYAGGDLSIAYIEEIPVGEHEEPDNSDAPAEQSVPRITGRVLVCESRKRYGRAYGTPTLLRLLQKEGWTEDRQMPGARFSAIELQPGVFLMPYLDNSNSSHRAVLLDGSFYLSSLPKDLEIPSGAKAMLFTGNSQCGYVGAPKRKCHFCERIAPLQDDPSDPFLEISLIDNDLDPSEQRLTLICQSCFAMRGFAACTHCHGWVQDGSYVSLIDNLDDATGQAHTSIWCRSCLFARFPRENIECSACQLNARPDIVARSWLAVISCSAMRITDPTITLTEKTVYLDAIRHNLLNPGALTVTIDPSNKPRLIGVNKVYCPTCAVRRFSRENFRNLEIQCLIRVNLPNGAVSIFPCCHASTTARGYLKDLFGKDATIGDASLEEYLTNRLEADDPLWTGKISSDWPRWLTVAPDLPAPLVWWPSGQSSMLERTCRVLMAQQIEEYNRRPINLTTYGEPFTFEEALAIYRPLCCACQCLPPMDWPTMAREVKRARTKNTPETATA